MRINRLSPLQGLQILPICRQLTLLSGLEQASAQLEPIRLSRTTVVSAVFKKDHAERTARESEQRDVSEHAIIMPKASLSPSDTLRLGCEQAWGYNQI
jgi:hypothetical protein